MQTHSCIAIDDDPLFLRNLETLIREIDWIRFINGYSHPVQGATAIFNHKPDIILVDIEMPHVDGYALLDWIAPRLSDLNSRPKIIVISANIQPITEDDGDIAGYIYKPELKDSSDLERFLKKAVNKS